MKHQAVIFDLFETLITEWGHRKYVKSEMCQDLGVERELFDRHWESLDEGRYLGKVSFVEALQYVGAQCGVTPDEALLQRMLALHVETKSACFEHVDPEVYELLEALKATGLKLAIVSNCSPEEVIPMAESRLAAYFDEIILSCEVGLKKPDSAIYQEAARRLGVAPGACAFVGDGGSHELEGARAAGMTAIQAKWYTDQHPWKRESMPGFLIAERPLDVLRELRV